MGSGGYQTRTPVLCGPNGYAVISPAAVRAQRAHFDFRRGLASPKTAYHGAAVTIGPPLRGMAIAHLREIRLHLREIFPSPASLYLHPLSFLHVTVFTIQVPEEAPLHPAAAAPPDGLRGFCARLAPFRLRFRGLRVTRAGALITTADDDGGAMAAIRGRLRALAPDAPACRNDFIHVSLARLLEVPPRGEWRRLDVLLGEYADTDLGEVRVSALRYSFFGTRYAERMRGGLRIALAGRDGRTGCTAPIGSR